MPLLIKGTPVPSPATPVFAEDCFFEVPAEVLDRKTKEKRIGCSKIFINLKELNCDLVGGKPYELEVVYSEIVEGRNFPALIAKKATPYNEPIDIESNRFKLNAFVDKVTRFEHGFRLILDLNGDKWRAYYFNDENKGRKDITPIELKYAEIDAILVACPVYKDDGKPLTVGKDKGWATPHLKIYGLQAEGIELPAQTEFIASQKAEELRAEDLQNFAEEKACFFFEHDLSLDACEFIGPDQFKKLTKCKNRTEMVKYLETLGFGLEETEAPLEEEIPLTEPEQEQQKPPRFFKPAFTHTPQEQPRSWPKENSAPIGSAAAAAETPPKSPGGYVLKPDELIELLERADSLKDTRFRDIAARYLEGYLFK